MPSITITTEQLTEISSQLAALQSAIAALLVETEPEQPVEPEPEPELQSFRFVDNDQDEWRNGVSTAQARFFLQDTPEARAQVKEGRALRFADGQVRTVIEAKPIYNNILVTVDGDQLIDTAMGHPNTVSVSGDAGEAEPEGELPQPEPMPPANGTKRKGMVCTNLGMGQGAPSNVPGTQGTHFNYPVESEIVRGKGYGFTRYRVGGIFERFFKRQGSTEMYLGKDAKGKEYSSASVIRVGQLCKKHGCTVLWNPFHNYGTVFGKKVGSSDGLTAEQFGQAWRTFILHVKSDPDAWAATFGFDLMNEWSGMQFPEIFDATQAVLDACADILEDKMICPEGKDFSSTVNWVRNNDGFKNLKDPRGPGFIEFSGHLYLDSDASGYYKSDAVHPEEAKKGVTPEAVGTYRLQGFADWIDQHGFRGNIGETIVPGDMPRLLKGLENMLVMARDRGIDVYIFGLGDWFSDNYSTVHNLEIERNKPTLELVQRFTKGQV